ncbi:MAG: ferritin [Gemmatimonadetes bacterium]|nr:ferritin [Gemmatimonadota bacterium]NNM07295.1 ferritin [Gemmatimonadota bacterium]
MMNDRMQQAFSDQINEELFSSYVYLAMTAHFEAMSLEGFAAWMNLQAQEELAHAKRLFDHINRRGGRVRLKAIGEPPEDFGTPLETFEKALAHEQHITGCIHKLYKVAQEEDDYPAQLELQWFVDEQVEEEENAGRVVEQLKMAGGNQVALLMLDRELGQRSPEEEE